jgi:MYXO-CTERM domain-containing protein
VTVAVNSQQRPPRASTTEITETSQRNRGGWPVPQARVAMLFPVFHWRRGLVQALGGLALLWSGSARADCGELDCGPNGSCSPTSLLARCDCESGYFSLRVRIQESSLGAYCVPEPVPPDTAGCDPAHCEPHGTCAISPDADGGGAECVCDPGYRREGAGCLDDPDDDGDAVCAGVRCGDGNACLPTPQGPTCRCLTGGSVALGAAEDGKFGPVCTNPPNPRTACGPDACGPYGTCVISQAARCDCDEGATLRTLVASDGKDRPYCVDPSRPWPPALPALDGSQGGGGISISDAGTGGAASNGGGIGTDRDAGTSVGGTAVTPGPTTRSGCQCRTAGDPPGGSAPTNGRPWLWGLVFLGASLARRGAQRMHQRNKTWI